MATRSRAAEPRFRRGCRFLQHLLKAQSDAGLNYSISFTGATFVIAARAPRPMAQAERPILHHSRFRCHHVGERRSELPPTDQAMPISISIQRIGMFTIRG